MCSVKEEASDDAVPLFRLFTINLDKLSCHHAEIISLITCHSLIYIYVRRYEGITGADIGDFDFLKSLLLCFKITEAVNEWENLKLLLVVSLIQNEVRCQKHKISEFIPLWFVTLQCKVKYQTAHSTSWV